MLVVQSCPTHCNPMDCSLPGFSVHRILQARILEWVAMSAEELILLNCNAGEDSRVPGTSRRSNQSILKEINPEYSLKELMLKLKLLCFGHLMQRADSLEKTLMLGKMNIKGEGSNRG